jgi:hypothetical protein
MRAAVLGTCAMARRLRSVRGVHRLAVLAVLLVPAVASADPPDADPPDPGVFYVTAAVGVGGVGVSGARGYGGPGFDVAASGRFGDWWIRAALTEMAMDEDGTLTEPRMGVERRTHDNPNVSVFGGFDAGYLSGSDAVEDTLGDTTLRGPFVMPRGGVEVGGEHVRFRFELDFPLGYGRSVEAQACPDPPRTKDGFLRGITLMLGFTVR